LIGRATEFLEGLPADVVYTGFSMGASTAHYFAVTREKGDKSLGFGALPTPWVGKAPGMIS
jgi:hypothetical protein